MEAKNILDVEKFVCNANDMLSGKFFDVSKRLEKLLASISDSDDMLDVLAEYIDGFDYDTEFEKAFAVDKKTGAARVALPVDEKKKLALCITLFNDIVYEKLNATQFLETYFQDKRLTPTQSFLDKVVMPFRDGICKVFGVSTNLTDVEVQKHIAESKPEEKDVEQFPHLDELLTEVVKTCNQILAILKFEKKRTDMLDDAEFVVQAILAACDKRDLMIVNGLVIGLEYTSRKFKNIRHLVQELNDCICNYYEFLENPNTENAEE